MCIKYYNFNNRVDAFWKMEYWQYNTVIFAYGIVTPPTHMINGCNKQTSTQISPTWSMQSHKDILQAGKEGTRHVLSKNYISKHKHNLFMVQCLFVCQWINQLGRELNNITQHELFIIKF